MLKSLFPQGEPPDPMAWVILAVGVVTIVFLVWVWASVASASEYDCEMHAACTGTNWKMVVLPSRDTLTPDLDMSEEECFALMNRLHDAGLPAFAKLVCVEYPVARQDT